MNGLVASLREVDGVKAVEQNGNVFKLNLFSREVPGRDLFEIPGNLRSSSQKIRHVLEDSGTVEDYEFIAKPEKKYRDKGFSGSSVSDREGIGYKRDYYKIVVKN